MDTCSPVFTAALLIVAKIQKQLKCPSGEWIKEMWDVYTIENYSDIFMKCCHLQQHAWTWRVLW